MKPWVLTIGVTVAVKNGPSDMLGPFAPHPRPLGPAASSPLWVAGGLLLLGALAPSIYRGMKDNGLAAELAGLLTASAVGLLTAIDVLARGSALPPLVLVVLAVAFVALRVRHHRSARPATPNAVVNLARYRENRKARRRADSR